MRHAFRFPKHIREAVRDYVHRAAIGIDTRRYQQEHAYTAALLGRLDGTAYEGTDGRVAFKATIISDRGPGAGEKRIGADFAITADISDREKQVRKAILVQSKRGTIDQLRQDERRRLIEQIDNMKEFTNSPKVMEIPRLESTVMPNIVSGNVVRSGGEPWRYTLGNYFVQRVITTLDGDTRHEFVEAVQESNMTKLFIIARLQNIDTP